MFSDSINKQQPAGQSGAVAVKKKCVKMCQSFVAAVLSTAQILSEKFSPFSAENFEQDTFAKPGCKR